MIDQNPKLSKSDTKLLLRYVTAHDQAQNIAKLIGVAPARISEGKKGEWQLPKDSAEKLYQNYGRPQAAPGIYLVSEVWTSLQEVIETTEQVLLARQWLRAKKALQSQQAMDILKKCLLPIEVNSYINDSSYKVDSNVAERLYHIIHDAEFQQWYAENRSVEEVRDYGDIDHYGVEEDGLFTRNSKQELPGREIFDAILSRHGLVFPAFQHEMRHTDVWIFLLLICELSLYSSDRVLFEEKGLDLNVDSVVSDEISDRAKEIECVIVGEEVWHSSSWLDSEISHESPQFFNELGDASVRHKASYKKFDELLDVFPERFNKVSVKLIINQNLEYHLAVELNLYRAFYNLGYFLRENESLRLLPDSEFDCICTRRFVIRDLPSDQVVETVKKLSEWLGAKDIGLSSLKSELARNGGFVPEVKYI
ncbi:hypothetical protein [Cobetia marina]|uniref:hypothetical protein n=1 Tax=Cobetia marina TaxID=28258 RepID=UPI00086554C5|nr:hypothetical protein [Cobetia marina]AOM01739.1 hypothetical protein BFX80_11070 [Cobetia marina]